MKTKFSSTIPILLTTLIFSVFGILASLRGDAAQVLLPLQTCGISPAANRNVTLTPLQALGSNTIPVMDKIQGTTDGNGNWSLNLMPGVYEADVRPAWGQVGITEFYFYVDPTNAVQDAFTNLLTDTNNTWPPNQYAYSAAASDARYAPAGTVATSAEAIVAEIMGWSQVTNAVTNGQAHVSFGNYLVSGTSPQILSISPAGGAAHIVVDSSSGQRFYDSLDALQMSITPGGVSGNISAATATTATTAGNSTLWNGRATNNDLSAGTGGPNDGGAITNLQGSQVVGAVGSANALGAVSSSSLNTPFQTRWMTNPPLDWWSADTIFTNNGFIITNLQGRLGNQLVGNAWYAAQAINGHPAVYFDGTGNNILTNTAIPASSCSNNCTIFCVYRQPQVWVNQSEKNVLFDGYTANSSLRAFFSTAVDDGVNLPQPPQFNSYYGGGGNSTCIDQANYTPTDDTRVFCISWSATNLSTWWDGKIFQNQPALGYGGNATWYPEGFVGTLTFGGIFNAPTLWPFHGYLAEFLVYSNALPAATIDQINNYFLQKYGLLRNNITFFGDSMIFGGASLFGQNWSYIVSTNFPNWSIDNQGVPGITSAQVLSNVVATVGTCCATKKIALVWCNGENGSGETLSAITNNLITIGLTLQTNGWLPILVDPPSNYFTDTNRYGGASGVPAERFQLQQIFTNCWQQMGYDGIIDLARDPFVGPSNSCTNTTFYPVNGQISGGGAHWSAAGYSETAPAVIAAIHAVEGDGYWQLTTNAAPSWGSVTWQCSEGGHFYISTNPVAWEFVK